MPYLNKLTGDFGLNIYNVREANPNASIPDGVGYGDFEWYAPTKPAFNPATQVAVEIAPVNATQQWRIDPAPVVVPSLCTPAQGLIALFALKQITQEDLQGVINGIPDPVQRYTAQIGFQRATVWERGSATMQTMAMLLSLSETDLNDLFSYAAGVQV